MREILFCGKRIDNGEWVHGFYIHYRRVAHYIIDIQHGGYEDMNGEFFVPRWYAVDPSTVGQYTGLPDKNGKRIFEGDIVKFCDIKGVINFSTGCYCVKTNKPDWKSRNNPAIDIVLNEYENELEIIGNIHDNPELLKGENDG